MAGALISDTRAIQRSSKQCVAPICSDIGGDLPGRRRAEATLIGRALRVLDNERLVPRPRMGMTRADVLAEVGGDWRARPALGRPVQFFEAEDIPVQLVVDERDLVVEVRPWPFISARP